MKNNLIITSKEDFAKIAAEKVADKIIELKKVNLVLATGNTMIKFLNNLAEDKRIDWKNVNIFHLDEYKSLDKDNKASFVYFIEKNLVSKIKTNTYYLADYKDIKKYTEDLNKLGGADILMLGVGGEGHLAFNEKNSPFDSTIREVKLTETTIQDNKPDYPDIENNPYAITMGIKDIISAKNIFFLAKSKKKAAIVKKALEGPITEEVPASILQKVSNLTIILDKEAASELDDK